MASLPAWPTRGERKRSLPVPVPAPAAAAAATSEEQENREPVRRRRARLVDEEQEQEDEDDEDVGLAPELTDVVAALGLLAQRLHAPSSSFGGGGEGSSGGQKKKKKPGPAGGRAPPPPPPPPPPNLLPVVLQHQLYTVLDDATAADVELEALRRQNHVRLLKVLTQRQADVAVCLTSAYLGRIQAAIDQCGALASDPMPAPQGPSASGDQQQQANDEEQQKRQRAQQQAENEARIYALRFLRAAVGRFTSLSVTRPELESAMTAFASAHPLPAPGLPPSTAAAPNLHGGNGRKTKNGLLVDRAVRALLKLGFLARRVDSRMEEAYWFSVPELGRVTASLPAGRKAILAALRRSRYKELSERNVQALDLRGTALTPAFHVADLVGAKEVLAVDTAAGRFLRLPPGAAAATVKKKGR